MRARKAYEPTRDFLPQSATWDDSTRGLAMGCLECALRGVCGGLRIDAEIFSCRDFCSCSDPQKCDMVCPNKPKQMVLHYREVSGFNFGNVPRAPTLEHAVLPMVVPYVEHPYRRERTFEAPCVAVPLHKLYDHRTGRLLAANKAELAALFRISPTAAVVASGVARDNQVESWWRHFWNDDLVAALRVLGLAVVTVPNFSLFTNVPRHDNLHAMKRIALAWASLTRAGVPAALHLNARSPTDYKRWTDFVGERSEVRSVAFEFGTGCGSPTRIEWHLDRLVELADAVGRPLQLVLRGGQGNFGLLRRHFASVAVIETEAFRRTHKRRRGERDGNRLRWRAFPTDAGAPLDDLLEHNVRLTEEKVRLDAPWRRRSVRVDTGAKPANDGHDESGQMSLLR